MPLPAAFFFFLLFLDRFLWVELDSAVSSSGSTKPLQKSRNLRRGGEGRVEGMERGMERTTDSCSGSASNESREGEMKAAGIQAPDVTQHYGDLGLILLSQG